MGKEIFMLLRSTDISNVIIEPLQIAIYIYIYIYMRFNYILLVKKKGLGFYNFVFFLSKTKILINVF